MRRTVKLAESLRGLTHNLHELSRGHDAVKETGLYRVVRREDLRHHGSAAEVRRCQTLPHDHQRGMRHRQPYRDLVRGELEWADCPDADIGGQQQERAHGDRVAAARDHDRFWEGQHPLCQLKASA